MASHVQEIKDEQGWRKVVLKHASGSRAEVYLYGAHVVSWTDAAGREVLFMSAQSHFEPGVAIRGGIPVVFPQFASGPLPKHGFARTREWELADSGVSDSDEPRVVLRLRADAETWAIWPYEFAAELEITLGASLQMALKVTNTDQRPFDFTSALHTYFRVGDIQQVEVQGLRGLTYWDKVAGGAEREETGEVVTISEETDRVYLNTPSEVRIHNAGADRNILLTKRGFADLVVWNPWIEKAQELDDLGDEEYRTMLCAEAAQVHAPVRLAPGETWIGSQILESSSTRL